MKHESEYKYEQTDPLHRLDDDVKPREKLQRFGAPALTNEELLAIIIGSGVPGHNVMQVSELLLNHFGGLEGLARQELDDLIAARIPAIGGVRALEVSAALELGKRVAELYTIEASKEPVISPARVFKVMWPLVRHLQQESFWVLLLNVRQKMIGAPVEITRGLLNSTQYHPREIFSRAVSRCAQSVILAHNHPSGDSQPSTEDVQATQRLIEAGKVIGITVCDHVVIGMPSASGGRAFYSMRQEKTVRFE